MKFIIFSDTHFKEKTEISIFIDKLLNENKTTPIKDMKDINVILAGDIFDKPITKSMNNLGLNRNLMLHLFKYLCHYFNKVYYILGNHEYYGNENYINNKEDIINIQNLYKNFASFYYLNLIVVCRNNFFPIGDEYELTGCTLWCERDIRSYQISSCYRNISCNYELLKNENLEDYNFIKNYKSNIFYKERNKEQKSIVVSHYPPLYECIPDDIKDKENYGNKYEKELFKDINYWICGHIHESYNKEINGCKIIINPYHKNKDFRYKYYEL